MSPLPSGTSAARCRTPTTRTGFQSSSIYSPHDLRTATELPAPEPVAKNDDPARPLISVLRQEVVAQQWPDAERPQSVSTVMVSPSIAGPPPPHRRSGRPWLLQQDCESWSRAPAIRELPGRGHELLAPALERFVDQDQSPRIGQRRRPKQHAVDDREHRDARADAHPQRHHGCSSETRGPDQLPSSESKVVDPVTPPA